MVLWNSLYNIHFKISWIEGASIKIKWTDRETFNTKQEEMGNFTNVTHCRKWRYEIQVHIDV
jgi:hypothetical protein